MEAQVSVGTMVRVTLHGRRVGGWVVELAHELVKRHHRAAWGWRAVADPGGLQPPFADAPLLEWRDARSGRADLRHRPVAVGDDDRLARRGQADIFGELVLQAFQADGAHAGQSGLWRLLFQFDRPPKRLAARHTPGCQAPLVSVGSSGARRKSTLIGFGLAGEAIA